MAKLYSGLTEQLTSFISEQKIFFVATAAEQGSINISPKGMDSFRIIDDTRVIWLNVTGSGNETSAQLQQVNRMTLMFCSFSGDPLILRLYGKAREITSADKDWDELYSLFSPLPGNRQIFDLNIDQVQTSCGMAVPLFDYVDEREQLNNWAEKKGADGIKQYWQDKNQLSLDGFPTNIIKK